MKHAWEFTKYEWQGLSVDVRAKHPMIGGCMPEYHCNYHLIAVQCALRAGEPVPIPVVESYPHQNNGSFFKQAAMWAMLDGLPLTPELIAKYGE